MHKTFYEKFVIDHMLPDIFHIKLAIFKNKNYFFYFFIKPWIIIFGRNFLKSYFNEWNAFQVEKDICETLPVRTVRNCAIWNMRNLEKLCTTVFYSMVQWVIKISKENNFHSSYERVWATISRDCATLCRTIWPTIFLVQLRKHLTIT